MASPDPCKPPEMNDQAVLRAVLPSNGPKLLARLLGSPVETARHYFYRHLSASRRREVALALLAELDRQERRLAVVRQHLEQMVGDHAQVAGSLAGDQVVEARGQANKAVSEASENG